MSEAKPKPRPNPGMIPRRPSQQSQQGATEVQPTPWYDDHDKIERFYINKLGELAETTVPAAYDMEVMFSRFIDESDIDPLHSKFSWQRHHTQFRKQVSAYAGSKSYNHGKERIFGTFQKVPGLLTAIPRSKDQERRKHHLEVLRADMLTLEVSAREFVDRLNYAPYRNQVHEAAGLLALRSEMGIYLPGEQYETAILPFVRLDERINFSSDGDYSLKPHARTIHEHVDIDTDY